MKKVILLVAFLSFSIGFSQKKEEQNFKKNELKINALFLVLGAGEFSYERLINDESGVGASLFFSLDKDINTKIQFAPYYRFYFGKKTAAGFFVEGFGMLNVYQDQDKYFYYYDYDYSFEQVYVRGEKATDFAFGFGLGGKWITKRGITFELHTGVGRNLFNDKNDDNDNKIVGRGGITVGYRF